MAPGEAKRRALELLIEYQRTQDLPTLQRAIASYHQVIATIPRDDADRATCLSNLGCAQSWLGQRTADVTMLRNGARACQEAAAITPADHPDFVNYQYNISHMLARLFEETADIAALREAVQAARNTVRAVPADHPSRAEMLVNLGDTLQLSHEWLGALPDLHQAVRAFREALAGYPPGSSGHAACLSRLCVALRLVYGRTEDLNVLQEAVETGRRAVDATPLDSPNHVIFRGNLGNALRKLYERTRETTVLREALEIARNMVAEYPTGHHNRAIALNILATVLRLEYERTGELPVLREAVAAGRDAVAAILPPHTHLATYKMNLVTLLRMLADRTGDRALAHEAVLLGQEAIESFRPEDPERAVCQSILSHALVLLAELTADTETTLKAVRAAEDALEATPYDHPDYVAHLTSLINALMALYRRTDVRQFLDRAVRAASNAVAATPPDHPQRAGVQSTLCVVLEAAAQAGTTGLELQKAVRFARDSVAATTPDNPERAALLSNLADVLALQGEQASDAAAVRESLSAYAAAARMTSASATVRIKAGQRAARLALLIGHRNQAMALAEAAVELVPQMSVRDVERASREHRLRAVHGLAATAAAAAVSTGNPNRAVELLEQTRGLVLAGTLETRSDLTELQALAPDLAGPFEQLRQAVNALDHESMALTATLPTAELGARQQELANRRARFNQEWDRLLARIRQRRGLERFLQPLPIDVLREQAAHGPIVYIAIHEQHGYALIIRDDPKHPVHTLTLPTDATESAVIQQVSQLRAARRAAADPHQPARERRAAQQRILGVLSWTWDTITEPVLRHLGHIAGAPEHGPWPRIWWCPVGLVAYLPLHAAGRHARPSHADTVMERVVSSYTPTIRALAYVRERPPAPSSSTLVIAVPDAPESPPLDAAVLEANAVRELIPDATVLPPPGTRTNHDSVIDALQHYSIAHLACHGVASWTDPANSRLILHDHLTHPLTLHDITQHHLKHAQLAYLSACSTTDSNPLQVDEATQLTAAFQLAGYRNVIGTLWPITDHPATAVAHDVYSALTSNGTKPPALDQAAQALHRATRNQRNQTPKLPTRWAAYIHYGV